MNGSTISSETYFPARPFIVFEDHDTLKLFLLWAKRGTAVVSGSCAHVCTLSLSDFCISFCKNETAILLKTKVEMPTSVSTNRNQVWPEDEIGGNQRN